MAREQTGARRRRGGQPNAGNPAPAATASATSGQTTQQGDAQPQQPSPREALKQMLVRGVMMYALYHFYIKPKTQQPEIDTNDSVPASATGTTSTAPQQANPLSSLLGLPTGPVPNYYNMKLNSAWGVGTPIQMRICTTLESDLSFRDALRKGEEDIMWSLDDLDLSTVKKNYVARNITLTVPPVVWEKNTTWYAHIFVATGDLFNKNPDTITGDIIEKYVLHARHQFVTWLHTDLKKEGKRLLGEDEDGDGEEKDADGKSDNRLPSDENAKSDGVGQSATKDGEEGADEGVSSEEDEEEGPKVRYDQVWKPTIPINLVVGHGVLVLSQLPPPAAEQFRVSLEERVYYPPLEVNEFWTLREHMLPMNDTVTEIDVEVSFAPISLYKWSVYKQFDNVWKRQIGLGMMRPEETDDLKRMFIETNPVLLGTTMVVSLAHTVLEALAFKNDISHWKNIKSMEGVSVRTMIWKIVMEAIIFLYLWDNETSWMITIGNGVGVAIAIWKLGKAVKFENFGKRKLLGFIPWFEMTDRESYSKETKEYDDMAMKYLGYALYPLVACYALYSLKYEKHKSWYSWVINSLVGAVYAFGFIMMFPQIFINYKLKSVAHMPMKAMMYKTLNTIIDDLFSFIIKMPWLHRLACFRDDIVFLIILYQRWIYPVDKTRVNEFGQQFDEQGDEKTETEIKEGDEKKEVSSQEKQNETGAEVTESETSTKPEEEKKND